MIRFEINKAKSLFFDRPAVMQAIDKSTRDAFSKFGAFVRRSARSSIRPARQKTLSEMTPAEVGLFRMRQRLGKGAKRPRASSLPGQPPRSHTGLLKSWIEFAFDPASRSVVVGPMMLRGKASGTAPEVLEYGGTVRTKGGKTGHIDARPYMAPAFNKNLHVLPRLIKKV